MTQTDARSQKSRRALLDAGIAVLLRNPSASLSEVAREAGVGRATLYRHFQTREELVRALALESLQLTDEAMAPIAEQNLKGTAAIKAMLSAIMPLADRFHFLLSLWEQATDTEVSAIYERQLEELATLVEQAKAEGSIHPRYSVTWVVTMIDSLIYGAWWLISQGENSPQTASDLLGDMLFNGLSQ